MIWFYSVKNSCQPVIKQQLAVWRYVKAPVVKRFFQVWDNSYTILGEQTSLLLLFIIIIIIIVIIIIIIFYFPSATVEGSMETSDNSHKVIFNFNTHHSITLWKGNICMSTQVLCFHECLLDNCRIIQTSNESLLCPFPSKDKSQMVVWLPGFFCPVLKWLELSVMLFTSHSKVNSSPWRGARVVVPSEEKQLWYSNTPQIEFTEWYHMDLQV